MPVDPKLWASIPFRNATAWNDFAGSLELWFHNLGEVVARNYQASFRILPIGSDAGGPTWLDAVQSMFVQASQVMGLGAPPDLASYDLKDAQDFASWCLQISQTADALRVRAGMT